MSISKITRTELNIGSAISGGSENKLLFLDKDQKLAVSSKLIVSDDTAAGSNDNDGVVGVFQGLFLMPDGSTGNNIENGPWLGGIIQDRTPYPDTAVGFFGTSGEPEFYMRKGSTVHGSAPLWPGGIPDTVFNFGGSQGTPAVRVYIKGQSDEQSTIVLACVNYSGTRSLFYIRSDGLVSFDYTNTAPGTTGDRTINKAAGKVNFAAGANTLTVFNNLCTTNSIVLANVLSDDATAQVKNVVPGTNNFVIHLAANAASETPVGWLLFN
jgi:hypothetical protein